MSLSTDFTAKYVLWLVPLLTLFNCGPKAPASPTGSAQTATASGVPPQTGEKMDFFPAVDRARTDIGSLIQLSESRVDATFSAAADSLITPDEKTGLDQLQDKENATFQELIVTLDTFLQYVPAGGSMDQNVTRGRNNVAAKYDSYAKSIDAGITDQFLDALEKTAIESNARTLIMELRFVESSLPLPFDSLMAGPTFVVEADSVDLFFEVVKEIDDMTAELQELKATIEQYRTAKGEMDQFLQREQVLTDEIQKSKTVIEEITRDLDTARVEQKEGLTLLSSQIDARSDSISKAIRQVDSDIRTDISTLALGIKDSIVAQREESDSLFFQVGTNIKLFREEIDSVKGVVRFYDIAEKGLPEINEDILNILKLPTLGHKVTLNSGTVIVGELLAEDLDVIIMQTALGKLVIEKNTITSFDEMFFPGPKVEFVGDYQHAEYEDLEEFRGMVNNVGKKKADFVKVTFFLWGAATDPLGVGSSYVNGSSTRFSTGVISDASVAPGDTATYHVIVEKVPGKKVAYITNEVKWREYK